MSKKGKSSLEPKKLLCANESILTKELLSDPHRSASIVELSSSVNSTDPEMQLEDLFELPDATTPYEDTWFSKNASIMVPQHSLRETQMSTISIDTYKPSDLAVSVSVGPPPTTQRTLPKRVDHSAWHSNLVVSQGSRGTCWAFAGIAALEAAYARRGIRVKLSEHYLFHISKAHENHRVGPQIHSLIGGGGSSDVVRNLKYWSVPLYSYAPYIDQPALSLLANSIPGTGNAFSNGGTITTERCDWFEYDLRHIPLRARWFSQYAVDDFGVLSNYSIDDLKRTLVAGYDVVVDVLDSGQGHAFVVYGYDDDLGVLLIKNSQGMPGFETMRYSGDPRFVLLQQRAYYIKSVKDVQTQWAAMWVGRWEMDHDGWRGRLVIRRYLDVHSDTGVPPHTSPVSLGTWYGVDGRVLTVTGGFIDGGRGLHCRIGDQAFELYLHSRDPYRAAGRCSWNNTWYGVVLSRGPCVGAGNGFHRTETIGLWDTQHDGWLGQMEIGVEPRYIQAHDGSSRKAWIDPTPIAHQIDAHVDFLGDNRDQKFQLLHHTREDGVFGGITHWAGRAWPAEARMSMNLYLISHDLKVHWYQHGGRYRRAYDWSNSTHVSTWMDFQFVFGGRDGVVYTIQRDGKLIWRFHDGRNHGSAVWSGPKEVGTGWNNFKHVFAGDAGIIYAVKPDGTLLWYRHLGRRDGIFEWQGAMDIGVGWNQFLWIDASSDGCIYALRHDGTLWWYRHFGYDHGYPIWHGPVQVNSGWQNYRQFWVAGNGFIYACNTIGQLWMWRHHGFKTGEKNWTTAVKVGDGWSGTGIRSVFMT